jgi:NAD(P)-dependent dehydrogenase (short-subunit alcohol dehydrogenase family)
VQANSLYRDLGGEVALVTGGGRGIGRAIALSLAKSGAGVAVVARSEDELAETVALIKEGGGSAVMFPADVTDWDAVEQLVKEIERRLGPIGLLINNAGVSGPSLPFWEQDPWESWRVVEINLRGAMVCSRAVLPGMVARHRGRIINMSSNWATRSCPFDPAYSSSKAAILRLTDSLAAALNEHGVYVFAITPGTVRTSMTERLWLYMETDMWPPGHLRPPRMSPSDWSPTERVVGLAMTLAAGKADLLTGRFLSVHDDLARLNESAEDIRRSNLYSLCVTRLSVTSNS